MERPQAEEAPSPWVCICSCQIPRRTKVPGGCYLSKAIFITGHRQRMCYSKAASVCEYKGLLLSVHALFTLVNNSGIC